MASAATIGQSRRRRGGFPPDVDAGVRVDRSVSGGMENSIGVISGSGAGAVGGVRDVAPADGGTIGCAGDDGTGSGNVGVGRLGGAGLSA